MQRPKLISTIKLTAAIVASLLLISGASSVRAQEDDSTAESEAMTRAKEQKAQADAKKAEADARKAEVEADKAEFEAKFPKPTSSPLAGTTTVDDKAIIESMMISYISMAKTANRIVDTISQPLKTKSARSLVIYNEKDANLRLSYRVANDQIKIIEDKYCNLLEPKITNGICPQPSPQPSPEGPTTNATAATAPLAIAQSFLGAFVDLTALLRTNVEIKGQTFDIDEGPLVAEVFRAARRSGAHGLTESVGDNLYYPFVFPPVHDVDSVILGDLERLHTLRVVAGQLIGDVEQNVAASKEAAAELSGINNSIKVIQSKEKRATDEANNLLRVYCKRLYAQPIDIADKLDVVGTCPRLPAEAHKRLLDLKDTIEDLRDQKNKATLNSQTASAKKDALEKIQGLLVAKLNTAFQKIPDDAIAQLKANNDQFDSFVESLIKTDAAGLNPLTSYIRIENLTPKDQKKETMYWLQVKVVKAGGNNRIKTNLIVDIFTGGNRLSHSGGAIVQYHLFDSDGKSVLSDTIADYTKYIKSNKIPALTNSSKPDPKDKEGSQVDIPQ